MEKCDFWVQWSRKKVKSRCSNIFPRKYSTSVPIKSVKDTLTTLHALRERCQVRSFFWPIFFCIRTEYSKIQTRKSSVFEHFSCSDDKNVIAPAHNAEGNHCVKRVCIRIYSDPHFSRIFPFSRIRTEYGGISPYSVRMQENAGKMRTRITPNTDSFYVVNMAVIFKKIIHSHYLENFGITYSQSTNTYENSNTVNHG